MAVYFVRNPRTGSVKIGVSTDPDARIRSLQTATEDRLEALHVEPGWGPKEERELHERFAALRTGDGGREWFRGDPELLAFVEGLRTRSVRTRSAALPAGCLTGPALATAALTACAGVGVGLSGLAAVAAWENRIYFALALVVAVALGATAWAVALDRRRRREAEERRAAASASRPPGSRP